MGTPFFPITLITRKLIVQGSWLSEKTIYYPYWFGMNSIFDRTVRTCTSACVPVRKVTKSNLWRGITQGLLRQKSENKYRSNTTARGHKKQQRRKNAEWLARTGNKENSCFVRLLGRLILHNLIPLCKFCHWLSWISVLLSIPESRLVKLPITVSRSQFQSRISPPFQSQIPHPGFKISQIPHPEKPIGDPRNSWEGESVPVEHVRYIRYMIYCPIPVRYS